MTAIILSQNLTPHSRLGNNLAWMARLSPILDNLQLDISYPWGHDHFRDYFPSSSKWVRLSDHAKELFKEIFNEDLTTNSLAQVIRLIELGDGYQNISGQWDQKAVVRSLSDQSLLFITGAADITNKNLLFELSRYKIAILHEPYEFIYSRNNTCVEDYSTCAPKSSLIDHQRFYIQSISGTCS